MTRAICRDAGISGCKRLSGIHHRVAVDDHLPAIHIDDPIVGDAGRGVQTRLEAEVEIERGIRDFDDEHGHRRMVDVIARRTDNHRNVWYRVGR